MPAAASDLQDFLRFLTQDARVPLATAMAAVPALQKADLASSAALAKAKPAAVKSIFPDDADGKIGKQVLAAAKRVAKNGPTARKRSSGDSDAHGEPAPKKRNGGGWFTMREGDMAFPIDMEHTVMMPVAFPTDEELENTVVLTNRAPLLLAFVRELVSHTMPRQPPSSKLSLAQGYVSLTSRARAKYLGIEAGKTAEEEGVGAGQPSVTIMGRKIHVLRRFGYGPTCASDDWPGTNGPTQKEMDEENPPLWALDLDAMKKSPTQSNTGPVRAKSRTSQVPIYTPQSAYAYLAKAFETYKEEGDPPASAGKKPSAAAIRKEKEHNLALVAESISRVYRSWKTVLSPEELDKKTWGWYEKVRPAVADGPAGWGGKGKVCLGDILALRRPEEKASKKTPGFDASVR